MAMRAFVLVDADGNDNGILWAHTERELAYALRAWERRTWPWAVPMTLQEAQAAAGYLWRGYGVELVDGTVSASPSSLRAFRGRVRWS